jgi:hypothetical protein
MIRLERISSDCKRPTRPLVPSGQRELPTATNPELSDGNKSLVVKPQMGALFQDSHPGSLYKGRSRVGVTPSPEEGNRSSFRNVVF